MRRRRTFLGIALSVALAASISLIGGVGLDRVTEDLAVLTPLLIAIPSLANLVGDYAAIIAAHTGDPKERRRSKANLLASLLSVLMLNVFALIALSLLLAQFRGFELESGFVIRYALFILFACVGAVLLMFGLAHMLDILLRRRRINPDELLTPIITSLADITMFGFVTLAVLTIF